MYASTAAISSSRKRFSSYLRDKEELVEEPFHRLLQEKQLMGYAYDGFWASMDTFKDRQQLENLHSTGAPRGKCGRPMGNGNGNGKR